MYKRLTNSMPFIIKNNICLKLTVTVLLITFFSCKKEKNYDVYPVDKQIIAKKAIVVTAHPLATDIGLEILKKGGNAVDAAVAVQFALAVVYPRAGNIGGGGFMVYRGADGDVASLDFREKAPLKADKDMYLDSLGNVIKGLSQNSHLAVGVPGVVDGMVKAHQKYGKLKWAELVEPAYKLAKEGILLTSSEAKTLNKYQEDIKKINTQDNGFVGTFAKGENFTQAELAETLSRIMKEGEAGFYEGKTADLFVEEMKRGNGIISHDDLTKYDAVWREAFQEPYKEYTIISMPPPSSGGIALCQLLNTIEQYPIKDYAFQSKEHIHLVTEVERRVYADRSTHLGDSDFWDVPRDSLINETYLAKRMQDFNPNKATSSDSISAGTFMMPESEETTHFSIVDQEGNAVSITTTLNLNYGSKIVVGDAGFFLNNEMDDFSAKPGVPNFFGLIGNEGNAIQPEKRMLSSMTPTIILKNDQLYMVVGTPGGSTIITSVFQTFVNVAEFGMGLKDAVHSRRFHSQWLPDKIFIEENTISPSTIKELEAMGHVVETRRSIGRVEAILVLPDGTLEGVADNRGDDDAGGM
ncbi:MAG: gamma-glutamyltranspeptidase/glutathione hydrolase [Maribacter sp.]|jgi:gamma-glutamyltranspeptidase/glutathione hydrolase